MMNYIGRYETERAQVVWNSLKSFNAQVLPRFVAQVAQVTCKPLFSLVPRFCPGVPQCSPHTPHTGGARLGAARTRNEKGLDRALETRDGQLHVVAVDRRRLGSATTGRQPLTLSLAPLSRQRFQLAQRLIRDVSGWSTGGTGGRLVGHSSHSNGGPEDGSHWLTKRSARAAYGTRGSILRPLLRVARPCLVPVIRHPRDGGDARMTCRKSYILTLNETGTSGRAGTTQGGLEIYSLTSMSTAPSPIFHKSVQFSHFSGGFFRG